MIRYVLLLCTAGLMAAGLSMARGEVLALYTFNGTSLASTDTAANSTANDLMAGSGVTAQFYTNNTTANTTSGASAYQGVGGWTTSLDTTNYFSFSISADAGYSMDLTSLTFYTSKNASGVDSWEIRSSLDGFSSSLGSGTGVYQGSPGGATWTQPTVNLGSLTGLSGSVEFRIYGYNGSSGNWRLDDVTLNGTVSAVPEPSTAALVVGGLAALWLRRRRFSRR